MLLIFLPIALIASTLNVGVDPIAVCFIVEPLAIIDVAVSMEKFPLTACLIVLPLTFISCIVCPNHGTSSVSQPSFPLASVDCSSLIRVHFAFQRSIILEVTIECLLCFVTFEILTLYLTGHLHNSIFSSLDVSPYQGLDSYYGEQKLLIIALF